MHPYRVKEYMWVLIVALFILISFLSGCSSTPRVEARKPQYCHTSQAILTKNGEKVESATLVECTDDQVKRLTASRMGLASNCGEFTYWMQVGGNNVQRKGISCQKLDGTWEVINTSR
jgi:hypothetical protein